MSFLAPLYIAGVLAISLPIIFHLIRRSPQGRQPFSSLMFLSPSPPTLTRRSRLTNILLLILRASALVLLALAFARPFFRQDATASIAPSSGRRIALLIDTSASMRREDLWQQAARHVDTVLSELLPVDEVALYLFDRQVRPAMTFAEWNELSAPRRAEVLKARLAQASPTWDSTQIGEALATAADVVAAVDEGREAKQKIQPQLVLISDMQRGGHAETLQKYEWPENVTLRVLPVVTKQATNASAGLVEDSTTQPVDKDARLRVRVSNEPGAKRENFEIAWANERGAIAGMQPMKVYVPPGRTQIVRLVVPTPDQEPDRLVLTGDEFDFDNMFYVVPPRKQNLRILYLGDDTAADTSGVQYYLHSAIGQTPRRTVDFVTRRSNETVGAADLLDAKLVVVTTAPADTEALHRYAEAGGSVLWVVHDAGDAAAQALSRVTRAQTVRITEASVRDYAMIARIEFEHPLFAPFADPRFSDFSKVRFWKYRRVTLESAPAVRILARFDNDDPFLIEQTIGQGSLLIMAAGWHPADSQLALSTKFVPLIEGMLRRRDSDDARTQQLVHAFQGADHPGIYHRDAQGHQNVLAVNLLPDESKTAPIAIEELEQWGVRLSGKLPTSAEQAAKQQHLQTLELENRQKLWRWIIAGVLGLLAVETALAGRLARRATMQAAEPQVTT